MPGSFAGIRGPFTPAQWIELEHQALIYKYFTANVPVPSTLLVPIRKAFLPFLLIRMDGALFNQGILVALILNLGDVAGLIEGNGGAQELLFLTKKYCETHINGGRHRSRKPVEGQTGQAASGPANPKVIPVSSSMSSSPLLAPGVCASNILAIPPQHQLKGFQVGASNITTCPGVNQ